MVSTSADKGFSYEITHAADSGLARAGVITTPHGQIQTPAFIPVGTKARSPGANVMSIRETMSAPASPPFA